MIRDLLPPMPEGTVPRLFSCPECGGAVERDRYWLESERGPGGFITVDLRIPCGHLDAVERALLPDEAKAFREARSEGRFKTYDDPAFS